MSREKTPFSLDTHENSQKYENELFFFLFLVASFTGNVESLKEKRKKKRESPLKSLLFFSCTWQNAMVWKKKTIEDDKKKLCSNRQNEFSTNLRIDGKKK
jgi:hypothetical protein